MIKLMLITNDAQFAKEAEAAGVDRIFVDLEINGKQERQGHLDTFITNHSMSDVARIRQVLIKAQLLVRLNPLFDGTKAEIDLAIEAGADLLMLPMFRSAEELGEFSRLVDGRVGIIPLIETKAAMSDLERIMEIGGLVELFVGLNDLHLDLGLDFMFELLSNGTIESFANEVRNKCIAFGFGGIARMDEGLITGRAVLAEHERLGSSSVILSRTFRRSVADESNLDDDTFSQSIYHLRELEKIQSLRSDVDRANDYQKLCDSISRVVKNKQTD